MTNGRNGNLESHPKRQTPLRLYLFGVRSQEPLQETHLLSRVREKDEGGMSMETITLMFLSAIGGAVLGIIAGTLLGWRRVVEMLDELHEARFQVAKLEEDLDELKKKRPEVIEIIAPIDPQNIPEFGDESI